MKEFMGKDFCLNNETAVILYEKYAKKMPIFDYHCHLSCKDIYNDRKFKDLTEVWLVEDNYGDHYKWRAMRAMGVGEEYITGNKTNEEKFMAWAKTVPYTIGNPLYHWVHLELRSYFGINELLNEQTGKAIYETCNIKLQTLTARKMIEMHNVNVICTTDDPIDNLEYHILLKNDKSFKTKVLPAFRPDKCINIENSNYIDYINKLSKVVNYQITNLELYKNAIKERIDFFNEVGCILSDHALDEVVYEEASEHEVNEIFMKRLNGTSLSPSEIAKFKGNILIFLGKEYTHHSWVQQYHINAIRNNSKRMMKEIGPDIGFDSINDTNFAKSLSNILGKLDETHELPKTILYSLNPKDNETLATIANCFNEKGVMSKIQFGSAWWFNDQIDGMKKQLVTLANMGLICNFVGMLTDSRSFLSYPRHDYFRRLLCSYFGELIENGLYPRNIEFVGKIIEDICYNNASKYFFS